MICGACAEREAIAGELGYCRPCSIAWTRRGAMKELAALMVGHGPVEVWTIYGDELSGRITEVASEGLYLETRIGSPARPIPFIHVLSVVELGEKA